MDSHRLTTLRCISQGSSIEPIGCIGKEIYYKELADVIMEPASKSEAGDRMVDHVTSRPSRNPKAEAQVPAQTGREKE